MSERTTYDVAFAAVARSVQERSGVIEKAVYVLGDLGIDPDVDLDTHVLVAVPKPIAENLQALLHHVDRSKMIGGAVVWHALDQWLGEP